jgi:hypothetical protein
MNLHDVEAVVALDRLEPGDLALAGVRIARTIQQPDSRRVAVLHTVGNRLRFAGARAAPAPALLQIAHECFGRDFQVVEHLHGHHFRPVVDGLTRRHPLRDRRFFLLLAEPDLVSGRRHDQKIFVDQVGARRRRAQRHPDQRRLQQRAQRMPHFAIVCRTHRGDCSRSPRRDHARGRQFTRKTPTTQTAMPRSASGASRSLNNAQAISAVIGGVR